MRTTLDLDKALIEELLKITTVPLKLHEPALT